MVSMVFVPQFDLLLYFGFLAEVVYAEDWKSLEGGSTPSESTVYIAQLVERRIVVPYVVGSNPTIHPKNEFLPMAL